MALIFKFISANAQHLNMVSIRNHHDELNAIKGQGIEPSTSSPRCWWLEIIIIIIITIIKIIITIIYATAEVSTKIQDSSLHQDPSRSSLHCCCRWWPEISFIFIFITSRPWPSLDRRVVMKCETLSHLKELFLMLWCSPAQMKDQQRNLQNKFPPEFIF